MLIEVLQLLSCLLLGLLVGSLLTEAVILVPYWRTMDAAEFLRLHSTMGPKLYTYFAPLTIAATIAPVVAAIIPYALGATTHWLSLVPAALVLAMLAIYFHYFQGANDSFKTGSVGADGLSAELEKWAQWHWLRVALGLLAFFTSLLVIL